MISKKSYEDAFFNSQHDILVKETDLSKLKNSTHLEIELATSIYFLIRSYKRIGQLKTAWDILCILEDKIDKFKIQNEKLIYLMFINLKVLLLAEKGLAAEALYYLPIFGEYIEDSMSSETNGSKHKFIAWYYYGFGDVFQRLGQIEQAFNFYVKALGSINNDESNIRITAEIFNKIAEVFYLKGELIHANVNFMKALSLSENSFYNYNKFCVLINLLEFNLYLDNYSEVENLFNTMFPIKKLITSPLILSQLYFNYFKFKLSANDLDRSLIQHEFQLFQNNMNSLLKEENLYINNLLVIGESIYLNKINTVESIIKSKEILENNLEKIKNYSFKLSIIAIEELCEIYLKEMKFLKQAQSFNSFQKLNQDLTGIAKNQHLYPLLIENFLLYSKMELLSNEQNNLLNAERFLILADIIAEEKKLKNLSNKIVREEINFKNQIDRWISLLPNGQDNISTITDLENDKSFYDLKKMLLIEKPLS